jgi:hypothetical protein
MVFQTRCRLTLKFKKLSNDWIKKGKSKGFGRVILHLEGQEIFEDKFEGWQQKSLRNPVLQGYLMNKLNWTFAW